MTSRRSEDNATTADWRSEKDGLYFDSTWPADSQGRKQPASTQITVTPSASILETSRAAQAANRERLDRRENEVKIQAEAAKEIKKEETEKKINKQEGAVPENKIRKVLPKRKGGAIFSWIIQELKEKTGTASNRLGVLGSELTASKNIMTLPSAYETYRFFVVPASGEPYALPAHTTFDRSASSFPSNDSLIHLSIIESTKDRLYFEVAGTLNATTTDEERYSWQLGLFFDSRKVNKSSYIYFFAKKGNPALLETSLFELRNVEEGFDTLGGLDPESKYPQPNHITGDPSKIYIERIELTREIKETFMNISTDTFGNPTTQRTFEWNRPGVHRIEGGVKAYIDGNDTVAWIVELFGESRVLTGEFLISDGPSGEVLNYYDFTLNKPTTRSHVTFFYLNRFPNPTNSTFYDQVEVIYTDKDYGELIWAE